MLLRWLVVPLVRAVHVVPPVVEVRIVPVFPTATHATALEHETARRLLTVLLGRDVHDVPPLAVVRIRPAFPTITHPDALPHDRALRSFVLLVGVVQALALTLTDIFRIAPASPTTMHAEVFGQATPFTLFVIPLD
jgi:hypothetical protein